MNPGVGAVCESSAGVVPGLGEGEGGEGREEGQGRRVEEKGEGEHEI